MEIYLTADEVARSLREDVRRGLAADPRRLPPKWFYDARGSELFERITELPEYYPTRAETAILRAHAGDIAAVTGTRTLIELGSGYSTKTRLLLDALPLSSYVMVDVSPSALTAASSLVSANYPALAIRTIVGDFARHPFPDAPARTVALLGGTIGNLLPAERAEFFSAVRAQLRPGEHLLLGTDLVKDPHVLVPAYDDAAGVTAEFNRNVLRVLNRELDADFDLDGFAHVALWDAGHEWIEMRLRARWPMRVTIPAVDLVTEFAAGSELRTEISAKFRREGVEKELAEAGFTLAEWWTDPEGRFAVSLTVAS
ncbi:L-histidine N(alpha)-methyltransferase [Symbioplanes lichenis]|uniref:L-histidine N(alpha)-methyltransferase n=1 Tax=Symbioplanes lichenis TaxID=1629072 RepID=UPI00273959B6|nr:L-histidine N(alpha)-methyltransferase [Actinoplanes lichenis]